MKVRFFGWAVSAVLITSCTTAGNQQAGEAGQQAASATTSTMTFFVTSTGSGRGADLGGLAGADEHCRDLARAAGAGGQTWRAYLSSTGPGSVNARDRIGTGPWRNAAGVVIARNADELHSDTNNLNKQTALTERGAIVPGRGDSINQHDILTGSSPEGRAISGDTDTTCGNWTSSGAGAAIVGHHDRVGLRDDAAARSWNSSHPSRGCSQANLRSSGGAGYFYCFAVTGSS